MTREDAIDYLSVLAERMDTKDTDLYVADIPLECVDMAIEALEQEPKTGHWEYVQYDGNPNIGNWHCSECNRIVSGAISAVNPVYVYKYCPNCGAKMESEEEQWRKNKQLEC